VYAVKERTKVKVSVLRVVYQSILPAYYRLNSLTDDVISGKIYSSELDKAALLEVTSIAMTLKTILEDYLEQAQEHSASDLYLPQKEFRELLSMSKVLEMAQRLPIANTGIWSH
tara:strand:- start:841 stop:1182 length:342 start_codon:yes stop_codon:yes gene_type:complete